MNENVIKICSVLPTSPFSFTQTQTVGENSSLSSIDAAFNTVSNWLVLANGDCLDFYKKNTMEGFVLDHQVVPFPGISLSSVKFDSETSLTCFANNGSQMYAIAKYSDEEQKFIVAKTEILDAIYENIIVQKNWKFSQQTKFIDV